MMFICRKQIGSHQFRRVIFFWLIFFRFSSQINLLRRQNKSFFSSCQVFFSQNNRFSTFWFLPQNQSFKSKWKPTIQFNRAKLDCQNSCSTKVCLDAKSHDVFCFVSELSIKLIGGKIVDEKINNSFFPPNFLNNSNFLTNVFFQSKLFTIVRQCTQNTQQFFLKCRVSR